MGKKVNKVKGSQKKKKPSSSLSFKGLTLWICVTIFVSAWMFVLGIFVGRGTAPVKFDIEKLQKELAHLKETGLKSEMRRYNMDANTEDNKTELGFYETLKETKNENPLDLNKTEAKKTQLPKKVSKPQKTENTKTPETPDTNKIASKEKSAPTAKKPKGQGSLTIQLAAFKDPAAADKLVAKLKKRGYPAYRIIGKIPGKGIWFRVRVGYYTNRTEADSMLSKLKKDKLKPILVKR
jgi:cell division septation protein DedD